MAFERGLILVLLKERLRTESLERQVDQDQMVIRAAEPDDVIGMSELLSQPKVIWGTLQLPFVSIATRKRRFEDSTRSDCVLVSVLDGKIIGSGGLHQMEESRRAHAATIGIAVHDAFAGRGVGGKLMAALLRQADNWLNIRRIEGIVWVDNYASIQLCERSGFKKEGLLKAYGWRDGSYADAFTIARLKD